MPDACSGLYCLRVFFSCTRRCTPNALSRATAQAANGCLAISIIYRSLSRTTAQAACGCVKIYYAILNLRHQRICCCRGGGRACAYLHTYIHTCVYIIIIIIIIIIMKIICIYIYMCVCVRVHIHTSVTWRERSNTQGTIRLAPTAADGPNSMHNTTKRIWDHVPMNELAINYALLHVAWGDNRIHFTNKFHITQVDSRLLQSRLGLGFRRMWKRHLAQPIANPLHNRNITQRLGLRRVWERYPDEQIANSSTRATSCNGSGFAEGTTSGQ